MRVRAALALLVVVSSAIPVAAQDRLRVSINAGQQASTTTVTQNQTFDRYFEQGSFTFERPVPRAVIYDAGMAVRLWRDLHAGAAMSLFQKTGIGEVTVRVPHPLHFNKLRTATGDITGVTRRELGQHFMVGWNIRTTAPPRPGRASRGLDFTLFAGPSVFLTDQLFVTSLMLSLENEVFPFDELPFPGAQTEILRDNVIGYNTGVDMTWRFARNFGFGLLVRYSHGKKEFTPTGAQPVEVTMGGLHAGGGLRLLFNNSSGARGKPKPPPPKPKQPPKGK